MPEEAGPAPEPESEAVAETPKEEPAWNVSGQDDAAAATEPEAAAKPEAETPVEEPATEVNTRQETTAAPKPKADADPKAEATAKDPAPNAPEDVDPAPEPEPEAKPETEAPASDANVAVGSAPDVTTSQDMAAVPEPEPEPEPKGQVEEPDANEAEDTGAELESEVPAEEPAPDASRADASPATPETEESVEGHAPLQETGVLVVPNTPVFRSTSAVQGFETTDSSCEQSLLVTGIPRVQCNVESMTYQFHDYGDVVSVVVAHGLEDDDELNDGCAIVTFALPDSARRGRLAVLSVPDADHQETPLTVAALKINTTREDPILWAMVAQASKVRIDGIDPDLGNDSSPEQLEAFKDDLASASGVEPLEIELHAQSGTTGWACVMFKGPKEAVKCIRSSLEMRGKHGIKTPLRACALLQSDLMASKDTETSPTKTTQAGDRTLHNSEGTDISVLPSVANVMRINSVRTVTEWYAPGDRTTKHTSGPRIGTTEYEVSFMDTTPDAWVPADWLGGLKNPQVMMMIDDLEERLQAADEFLKTGKQQQKTRHVRNAAVRATQFTVEMTDVAAKQATKLSKGPQWSPAWPPFYLAEEVLSEGIDGTTAADPKSIQQDELFENTAITNVAYYVRFSDARKFWIPEDVMRLHMETWTLVEIYKEETVTLAAIKTYIAEDPECMTMQRSDLIQHLRTVHSWRGGSGLGRHRVGKLLNKVLKDQPVPRSSTSGISRTRASTRARERSLQLDERKRLHRRRLKALPRSTTDDNDSQMRESYGDTLEMLGSTRHQWRHPAVLDDTPPIVSHGRLSQANLATREYATPDRWMAMMTLTSQGDHLHSDFLALEDRTTPNDRRAGNPRASGSRSLPNLSLPPVQLSRSAQEQFLLCETLTRQWEDEEASVAAIRATKELAQRQRRAQQELRATQKNGQKAIGETSNSSATTNTTSMHQDMGNSDRTDGAPPEHNGRKGRKKGSKSVRVRGGTLYSRKYVVNSAQRFQAKAFKDTWPYKTEKPQAEREPRVNPEPAPGPEMEPEPELANSSTALAVVEQPAPEQELPPLVRLTNLLENGQRHREPLNMTLSQIDSAPREPGAVVASGHGAGGVAVRPQIATFPKAQSFFFVTAEGKRSEEIRATALPRLLQSGVLASETMVCAVGWPAWKPLAECKDQLDTGGLLKSHAADLETNKHGTDLARHPAGLSGVSNTSLIEAGYSWNPLGVDAIAAGDQAPRDNLPDSFADIGQSSLPRWSSETMDAAPTKTVPNPLPDRVSLPLDISITDASSVRHASSDASLLRRGRLRCRQQTLAPTPTRQQTVKGATASASLRTRGTPLSRTQRELAMLIADGVDAGDAAWALKKAGNGGYEEAKDILLSRLPERAPQYEIVGGERVRRNPDGYMACESFEEDYWRRRSLGAGGETGPLLLGGGAASGAERSATPV